MTAEQARQLAALAAMPESAIDLSDVPEVRDWSGAVRGKHFRHFGTPPTEDPTD